MIVTRGQNNAWLQLFGAVAGTDVADVNSGGIRFNELLGRFDASIAGDPWNTLTTIFTHRKLRVDKETGDDALADEDLARPYLTIQAAIDYALSKPGSWVIDIGLGYYAEDVSIVSPLGDAFSIKLCGTGVHYTTIRSITVAQTTVANSSILEIENIDLGAQGAASPLNPLWIQSNVGALAVLLSHSQIAATTNAVDGIFADAAGGPGSLMVQMHDVRVFPLMGATGGRALAADKGSFLLMEGALESFGAAAVELTDASLELRFSDVWAHDANYHGVVLNGTAGLQGIFCGVEIGGGGGAKCVYSTSVNAMVVPVLMMLMDDSGAPGEIDAAAGFVMSAFPVTQPMGIHPVVTAGFLWRLVSAWHSSYDNTSTGLVATNVQDAIDEVASSALSRGALIDATGSPHFVPLGVGLVRVDVSLGPVTIMLQPNAAFGARTLVIKNEVGDAAVNPITLSPQGADTIEGVGAYIINLTSGAARIYGNQAGGYFVI